MPMTILDYLITESVVRQNSFHGSPSYMKTCHNVASRKSAVRYSDPKDRIFNRVISDISVVLWETTLTVSDSVKTVSPVKSEIVRVVSLSTTEITETTRFKKKTMFKV